MSGFQCGDDVDVPEQADVGPPGINVGVSYGHPNHDHTVAGVGDPCKTFTGGVYRIKKVVIEVIILDEDGNEVAVYPALIKKDGEHFANGNPNSPTGEGMKYKIPEKGAYKVKTKVYGYPCDELPNPNECLDCCDGDETALPYWEEESEWHEWKKDSFATAYISYPKFRYCI